MPILRAHGPRKPSERKKQCSNLKSNRFLFPLIGIGLFISYYRDRWVPIQFYSGHDILSFN